MILKLCRCRKASPANDPPTSDSNDKGIVGNPTSASVATATIVAKPAATSASIETTNDISSATPREIYTFDGESEVPKDVAHIEVSNGVTQIREDALVKCGSLETMTLQESFTMFSDWAIGGCSSPSPKYTWLDDDNESEWKSERGSKKLFNISDNSCASVKRIGLDDDKNEWISERMKSYVLPQMNRWHPRSSFNADMKTIRLAKSPVLDDNRFDGKLQKGLGPDYWGISREQILAIKTYPGYTQITMRQFVILTIKPITDGTGLGYALLINKKKPLKVKVMVSHAWDEPIHEFVQTIERSGEQGPFFVCALSIHQNNGECKGVTISQQLGSNPASGPFSVVLEDAVLMLAVVTSMCDIYSRLWCVYEIFVATQKGVRVRLCPFISESDLRWGHTDKDICIVQAKNLVDSSNARCGDPNSVRNDDEKAIRRTIEGETDGSRNTDGFDKVNQIIEMTRLLYLVLYPTEKIEFNKTKARDKIKEAIEHIIPRLQLTDNDNTSLTFDAFVDQLSTHTGFKKIQRPNELEDQPGVWDEDHHYYIVSDSDQRIKIDVFYEWSRAIRETVEKELKQTLNQWDPESQSISRKKLGNTAQNLNPCYNRFGGKTQHGWGPEYWGLSLEQLLVIKTHPGYNQMTIRDFLFIVIKPITDGTGMGYALLLNKEKPLKAKVFIDHAWDGPIQEWVETIERSGEQGPFWVFALSIYQNTDESKGLTVKQQMGSDIISSATLSVIRECDLSLTVCTLGCNIFSRLWYVFDVCYENSTKQSLESFFNSFDLLLFS